MATCCDTYCRASKIKSDCPTAHTLHFVISNRQHGMSGQTPTTAPANYNLSLRLACLAATAIVTAAAKPPQPPKPLPQRASGVRHNSCCCQKKLCHVNCCSPWLKRRVPGPILMQAGRSTPGASMACCAVDPCVAAFRDCRRSFSRLPRGPYTKQECIRAPTFHRITPEPESFTH